MSVGRPYQKRAVPHLDDRTFIRMMSRAPDGNDLLLTSAEVATLFAVHPATITRWSREGIMPSVRTIGGHRR